jgi:hypothetical protein
LFHAGKAYITGAAYASQGKNGQRIEQIEQKGELNREDAKGAKAFYALFLRVLGAFAVPCP